MRRYNFVMNELIQKRKQLGLTQIEAARLCGVSRRTYQTYEETNNANDTYEALVNKLDEMGVLDGSNIVLNVRHIKNVCNQLFKDKYPEVKSAYLFGSYAKKEATKDSDIDILLVCPPLGMRFYGIASELEDLLNKQIDLHTHRELLTNEHFLQEVLVSGIKIYG